MDCLSYSHIFSSVERLKLQFIVHSGTFPEFHISEGCSNHPLLHGDVDQVGLKTSKQANQKEKASDSSLRQIKGTTDVSAPLAASAQSVVTSK